jgi:5-methylthioadenosine/S-adenosylhomocysteine deaminase
VRFVTTNDAEANGLGHVVGQIAPGFQADIVLLDTRPFGCGEGEPAGHVVANCSQGDVRPVMVAGQFRNRDGKLLGVEMDTMLSERIAARDSIYAPRRGEGGQYKKAYWPWGPEH